MTNLGKLAAERLKEAREEAGLTQNELAEELGLKTRDAISKIENGRSTLTLSHLEKLPKILHKPISWFLGIDDPLNADEARILAIYRAMPNKEYRRLAFHALGALLIAAKEREDQDAQ